LVRVCAPFVTQLPRNLRLRNLRLRNLRLRDLR
jgi:hypothetical protein